jgi:hypothetical protein
VFEQPCGGKAVNSAKVSAKTLRPIIDKMVDEQAHLMTDTSSVLMSAGSKRKHSQGNEWKTAHAAGLKKSSLKNYKP